MQLLIWRNDVVPLPQHFFENGKLQRTGREALPSDVVSVFPQQEPNAPSEMLRCCKIESQNCADILLPLHFPFWQLGFLAGYFNHFKCLN